MIEIALEFLPLAYLLVGFCVGFVVAYVSTKDLISKMQDRIDILRILLNRNENTEGN